MSALRKPSLKGLYAPDRTTDDKKAGCRARRRWCSSTGCRKSPV